MASAEVQLPEAQPVKGEAGRTNEFPNTPGVYIVYDQEGVIQYVGMSRKVGMLLLSLPTPTPHLPLPHGENHGPLPHVCTSIYTLSHTQSDQRALTAKLCLSCGKSQEQAEGAVSV